MKPLLLFILSASLLLTRLAAQDVYEIKYTLPAPTDTRVYNAYIVLYGNGTGLARIKTGDLLAEMELLEQPADLTDTSFILYEATNAKIISGQSNDKLLNHHFGFKSNGKLFYTPWSVTTALPSATPPGNTSLQGGFIRTEDLVKNKPVVQRYFDSTHFYYRNLFSKQGTKGNFPWGIETKDTRMFLLIVASTYDSSLTPNVLIDARKVTEAFTDIAENGLGIRIFIDSVYGNRYNRESVQAALTRLKPGKNDIVVFYYSGHGFADQQQEKKQFPFLDLRDPNKRPRPAPIKMALNIEDIYKTIVAKGARMNLVLSDCCNDTVEAKKPKSPTQPPSAKGPVKYFNPNMSLLFMQKKPTNILMTAATRDERAIITPRYSSYFTHFFLESLRTYMSAAKNGSNWYQVMEEAKKLTTLFAGKVPCPNGKNCRQTPKLLL